VGKTIGVAEKTALAAAGQVLPFAQKLTPLAAQPLSKVDNFANKGLEKLETNVPVIMKQPQEVGQPSRHLILKIYIIGCILSRLFLTQGTSLVRR
jgi:hypothetical protein